MCVTCAFIWNKLQVVCFLLREQYIFVFRANYLTEYLRIIYIWLQKKEAANLCPRLKKNSACIRIIQTYNLWWRFWALQYFVKIKYSIYTNLYRSYDLVVRVQLSLWIFEKLVFFICILPNRKAIKSNTTKRNHPNPIVQFLRTSISITRYLFCSPNDSTWFSASTVPYIWPSETHLKRWSFPCGCIISQWLFVKIAGYTIERWPRTNNCFAIIYS